MLRRAFLGGVLLLPLATRAGAQSGNFDPSVAAPPPESGIFRQSHLVELIRLDPTLTLDIRYATANNFAHRAVYTQARAFLQQNAAKALVRAHGRAKKLGYGFTIFDGYRPWAVTKLFWDITPPAQRDFVAKPGKGSRHNRGCAVDLTLHDLRTGQQVDMPSGYDDFTAKASPTYAGGTPAQRRLRDVLRHVMEREGFTVFDNEWWHFDYKDWRKYRIGNVAFESL
jgi:zinc D-Ala-D-Ala dipeptidase